MGKLEGRTVWDDHTELDATELIPRLSQGGKPARGYHVARYGYTTLVLCAQEYQPPSRDFPGLRYVLHVPLDDARPSPDEIDAAMTASMDIADLYEQGEDILITCIAGRNRSGLVSALSLQLITQDPMRLIVRHIQRKRHDRYGNPALTNPWFLDLLKHVNVSHKPLGRRRRNVLRRQAVGQR